MKKILMIVFAVLFFSVTGFSQKKKPAKRQAKVKTAFTKYQQKTASRLNKVK